MGLLCIKRSKFKYKILSEEAIQRLIIEWTEIFALEKSVKKHIKSIAEEDPITKQINASLARNNEGSKLPPQIVKIQSETIKKHSTKWSD